MVKRKKSRFILLGVALLGMMVALMVQLNSITISSAEDFAQQAENRMTRSVSIKGGRGRILDRNGVVLAYSQTSYNVEFFRDPESRTPSDSALYTEALIKAINIIEDGGSKTIDTSYIRMNENGELYYDWRVESEEAIFARYKNFCDAMGFYIAEENAKDMTKWPTAEKAYLSLRKSWQIPENMTFDEAVKIFSIRQEVLLNNYRAYKPVTIAYDVGMDIVAQIEMQKNELPGLQTAQSTSRVYPRGTVASHVVGYLNRGVDKVSPATLKEMGFDEASYKNLITIDDKGKQIVNMLDLGYDAEDMIGVSGVERSMESYLTGATNDKMGVRTIKVNKYGSMIRELEKTEPHDGNDVVLTLDIQLQQVTETALENLIKAINEKEKSEIAKREAESGYYTKLTQNRKNGVDGINLAQTGAIVVMDVNTGRVLSMASSPSFDPNMFIKGLSIEQKHEIFDSENAKKTTPMRNKAISAKNAPGSIFKMVTGLAGLMEGKISLTETIDDLGRYYLYDANGKRIADNAPKCHTNNPASHSHQDIVAALTNSCNYYFFEVANRLGIQLLDTWSQRLGLTSSTGIELPGEAVGMVGGQKVLYDNSLPVEKQRTSLPILIYNQIVDYLKSFLELRSMPIDEDAVKKCASRLMELQDGSVINKGADVRRIMSEELGIPERVSLANNWTGPITSALGELQWKATITIRSGIGQGVTLVTPIAVARYVSALANSGTVYDAHIVERILDDQGALVKDVKPSIYNKIEAPEEYWQAIRQGLNGVVSPEDRGTAAQAFSPEFAKEGYLAKISGKTGTAQTGTSDIDIENTSWFITYEPRDNPEIAIVVCVPYGYSGSSSAPAIEDITRYYLDRRTAAAPENLVGINELVP